MWVRRSQDLIPGEIKFTYTYSSFHTHKIYLKMIFNNQTDIKYNLRKFILSCNYPPKYQEENKLLHTKNGCFNFFFSLFKCDNNVPSLFLLPNFVIFLSLFFLYLFFFNSFYLYCPFINVEPKKTLIKQENMSLYFSNKF